MPLPVERAVTCVFFWFHCFYSVFFFASSRLAWLRDPWGGGEGHEEAVGDSNRDDGARSERGAANGDGSLFPPSNRCLHFFPQDDV